MERLLAICVQRGCGHLGLQAMSSRTAGTCAENELLGKTFEPTTIGLSCAIVPLAAASIADARMRRECAIETGVDSSCLVGPFLVKVSM